ncbi:hypothetical protein JCM10207_003878, partial [Rhodosporidiobolus poonsookiae]
MPPLNLHSSASKLVTAIASSAAQRHARNLPPGARDWKADFDALLARMSSRADELHREEAEGVLDELEQFKEDDVGPEKRFKTVEDLPKPTPSSALFARFFPLCTARLLAVQDRSHLHAAFSEVRKTCTDVARRGNYHATHGAVEHCAGEVWAPFMPLEEAVRDEQTRWTPGGRRRVLDAVELVDERFHARGHVSADDLQHIMGAIEWARKDAAHLRE